MKNLFEMLQAIFGKNIISKTIGTRTNVIKLPTNKSSPLKNEFDVFKSAENPAVFEKLKKVIEDEAPYISRMNDAERLIYEGNVKRLHDYLVSIGEIKPTITADVVGLTTKEPISGKGLESLVEEAGQTSPPGTLVGDIQSRINRLKNLAKEEGMSAEEILQDFASGQKGMSRLNDEGLVRSTAREILINDIKAGKIKNITVSEAINMGEPLDPFRRIYGEGALEQLDSLIPDFRNLRTEMEAEKFARSKFKFEPDENRLPGSVSIEEGRKAEQEFGINKSTPEVEEPQAEIIPFKKKPEEFAIGGPVGLDYLTGMEPSKGYADGGRIGFAIGGGKKILDLITKASKNIKGKKFTDDEMISYIKKYKEEGPTLEQFTEKINKETGSNFTPKQLEHAHRVKVAYPHSTPIVDSQGKFIGGALYNPPLDVSISNKEALTESIMQTRKAKGLDVPEKYQKAGEGKFTKQEVLEKIIQKTIDANPTDEYVQKTFPNFIKEIRAKPELANNENVWKTFTQDFPENKRLVVYGDDTVDFFTKGENLPEGMKQTVDLADTYGISMQEARRIKQMEPTDQVMEIKKLEVLKNKTQKEMSLEEEMNMVLNQYDKSMFIKNEQGMVDVTNPENVQKMAILLKKDHPEIYKRLEEGMTQTNVLDDFDVTGRKPNSKGGLNYLVGE